MLLPSTLALSSFSFFSISLFDCLASSNSSEAPLMDALSEASASTFFAFLAKCLLQGLLLLALFLQGGLDVIHRGLLGLGILGCLIKGCLFLRQFTSLANLGSCSISCCGGDCLLSCIVCNL